MYNIISDIAGNYLTFLALVEKMPKNNTIISVGDMVDRGPRSKQVLEYFRDTVKAHAVMGNHELMMMDVLRRFDLRRDEKEVPLMNQWLRNGGSATLDSYQDSSKQGMESALELLYDAHRSCSSFLSELPRKLELMAKVDGKTKRAFVTHAPFISDTLNDEGFTWNRLGPIQVKGTINIFGHQCQKEVEYFKDKKGEIYAIGIDTSASRKITGIVWPSLEIFEQEIID